MFKFQMPLYEVSHWADHFRSLVDWFYFKEQEFYAPLLPLFGEPSLQVDDSLSSNRQFIRFFASWCLWVLHFLELFDWWYFGSGEFFAFIVDKLDYHLIIWGILFSSLWFHFIAFWPFLLLLMLPVRLAVVDLYSFSNDFNFPPFSQFLLVFGEVDHWAWSFLARSSQIYFHNPWLNPHNVGAPDYEFAVLRCDYWSFGVKFLFIQGLLWAYGFPFRVLPEQNYA